MGMNVVNGMPARYLASDPTLTDGRGSALRVNINGYLLTTGGSGASASQVQGTAADNAAAVGNPVVVGGQYNATLPTYDDGDATRFQVGSRGSQNVTLMVQNSTSPVALAVTNADGIAASATPSRLEVVARQTHYNGTTHDLRRGNTEASLLASAARTTTTNSSDQTNHNSRGTQLILNVTANPGGVETLSLKIQAKDSISGNYIDIADAGVLFTAANGTKALTIYPGILAADLVSGDVGKSVVLPRTWRAVVTHSSTGSWTYSLSASNVN